ncbi:MAG: hypothetical protein DWI69_10340 [Chloroflexi bacterium]|nr:MAG: hypothetical protein DWI69_10340 [Chloroflexota bacterium]
MKLVCAILSDADANRVVEAVVQAGYPGPTRINTVGGFLRRGNVTLLLGVEDAQVNGALELVRSVVEARPVVQGARRATIFVLDTARVVRF